MMMAIRRFFLLSPLCLLAACALPVTNTDAGLPIPAHWRQAADGETDGIDADWWRGFGSAELDRLVGDARRDSHDIAAAVARLAQASARARVAGAALAPELSLTAGASRTGRLGGQADEGRAFNAGLSASYELDFWGGNRAARASALAGVQASRFDRDTVRLTVSASVASAYLQTLALRERAAIARADLARAERVLATVRVRAGAGAETPLALAQQRGLVASAQQQVDALAQQARDALILLASLGGHLPAGFDIEGERLSALGWPTLDAGPPSALLTRRPDLARAEARLAAADADITVARAAMLPAVRLTAGIGSNSDRAGRWLDNPVYSLAGALTAPIFNAGRLAAQRDQADARRAELLADYRQAIVAAFRDTELALNTIDGLERQLRSADEAHAQAQRALTLAERRYRAGADTLLTVLDTQRTLFAAEDERLTLRLRRQQAAVELFKALGGGWRRDDTL